MAGMLAAQHMPPLGGSWVHFPSRPAHTWSAFGIENPAEEPLRPRRFRIPAEAVTLTVVIGVMTVDVSFHVPLLQHQALLSDLGFEGRVVLIEVGQIGKIPPAIFIPHDSNRLDQNSFFRHDFVLAAIAADFELGEEVVKGSGITQRPCTHAAQWGLLAENMGST